MTTYCCWNGLVRPLWSHQPQLVFQKCLKYIMSRKSATVKRRNARSNKALSILSKIVITYEHTPQGLIPHEIITVAMPIDNNDTFFPSVRLFSIGTTKSVHPRHQETIFFEKFFVICILFGTRTSSKTPLQKMAVISCYYLDVDPN